MKYNENKYVSYMFTFINFKRCLVHSPPLYGWMTPDMAWKHKLSTTQCAQKDETKWKHIIDLLWTFLIFLNAKKKKKIKTNNTNKSFYYIQSTYSTNWMYTLYIFGQQMELFSEQ